MLRPSAPCDSSPDEERRADVSGRGHPKKRVRIAEPEQAVAKAASAQLLVLAEAGQGRKRVRPAQAQAQVEGDMADDGQRKANFSALLGHTNGLSRAGGKPAASRKLLIKNFKGGCLPSSLSPCHSPSSSPLHPPHYLPIPEFWL